MKRIILIAIMFCVMALQMAAITIETADFGYGDGSIRNFKQGAWNQASTDLSEGSGKSWSFSLPSTGYVNNTFQAIGNTPPFAGANIRCAYTQYINGIDDSGALYYQDNGSDILSIGYTGYPNLVWDPPLPTGLPHYTGKTWQGAHSYQYGSYTVVGKVISEGVLSTHLGSFPALCVRYTYTTTSLSYQCYQWETREYGIIAYSNTLNGGMLYVLHQASQNVATYDPTIPAALGIAVYPNPAQDFVELRISSPMGEQTRTEVYNLRGQLLQTDTFPRGSGEEQNLRLDFSTGLMPNGIYLLKVSCGGQIRKARILVVK